MENVIKSFLAESASIKSKIAGNPKLLSGIRGCAERLVATLKAGGTIYTCGNGGSTCDAMHFAEELVARYKRERPGIKAMHLMDAAMLTCWSNDYSFESAFERAVKTYCTDKDTLVAFSTSGNSKNVVNAVRAAKEIGSTTIVLTGKDGGVLKDLADISLIIPSSETDRIQESHITIVHIFCELIETSLYSR